MDQGGGVLGELRVFKASYALALRRLMFTKIAFASMVLSALPALIALLYVVTRTSSGQAPSEVGAVHILFETMLRTAYLHFIVFFMGSLFGFAIIRQELDDQTLHYLLLQPARRVWAILGKLFAYLTLSTVICLSGFWATYLILTVPWFGVRGVAEILFSEGRFVILAKESGVLVLGLLAYGAIAMTMGSFFKSGAYAVFLLLWEGALPYLPSTMKQWTLTHYLHSLLPERLAERPRLFELLGEPSSVLLSLGVLGGVSLVMIVVASGIFQFRECLYGNS